MKTTGIIIGSTVALVGLTTAAKIVIGNKIVKSMEEQFLSSQKRLNEAVQNGFNKLGETEAKRQASISEGSKHIDDLLSNIGFEGV